jgi:hypothetical protein
MVAYQCSLLDSAQRVGAIERIECEHDAEALIRAIHMLGDQTRYQSVEIWCGARIVARLPNADAADEVSDGSVKG